jgi:hypothetical protein
MAIERIERKEYPSFGECIYCGRKADEVELTDEHIVFVTPATITRSRPAAGTR